MELKKAYLPKGEVREFERGTSIFEILDSKKGINEPFAVILDGEEPEDLSKKLHYDVNIKPVGINTSLGEKTYLRTLIFVFIKATKTLYKDAKIVFKNFFSRGLYGEIKNIGEVTQEKIDEIKEKMKEIIESDIEIEKIKAKKSEAVKIYEDLDMEDKIRNLRYVNLDYVTVYKCGNFYDYFYGGMLTSTGYLEVFDLLQCETGFILMSPKKNTNFTFQKLNSSPRLVQIFNETQRVSNILDVSNVGSLNDKVHSNELSYTILVSESLHEKKVGLIADEIYKKKDKIKLVTVAGPDCSGKFTFTKRLSIQLRLLGFHPYVISLDDYLLDRKYAPSDFDGQYYLQSVNGIDIKLLNEHLSMLLKGEDVRIPKFDMRAGKRVGNKDSFRMTDKSLIIIEGEHGLNDILTQAVSREEKFKVYVSALSQLNVDDHNMMEPKDIRKCRKILKDYNNFNIKPEDTISNWPIVDRVENEDIFPFQEDSDAMFNSTVIYEMCILRKYIEPLLKSIPNKNPAYIEAKRLLDFVTFFLEADEKNIPKNSIIREFTGNSCFNS